MYWSHSCSMYTTTINVFHSLGLTRTQNQNLMDLQDLCLGNILVVNLTSEFYQLRERAKLLPCKDGESQK
uniref:Uncharacterized protein n=1 Tax=Rhizophora mucronata TaxID=61149 RepID=A0A2P2N6T3_RHIMU